MASGYRVRLVNTSVRQYEGLKYVDDRHDARWLARLLHLGILPTGYIYPKQERALRDLLRRRAFLVRQRTASLLSVKNFFSRNTGTQVPANELKRLTAEQVVEQFPDPHLALAITSNLAVVGVLNEEIARIEKTLMRDSTLRPVFQLLESAPGIGQTLALTIMYQAGSRMPDTFAPNAAACPVSTPATARSREPAMCAMAIPISPGPSPRPLTLSSVSSLWPNASTSAKRPGPTSWSRYGRSPTSLLALATTSCTTRYRSDLREFSVEFGGRQGACKRS